MWRNGVKLNKITPYKGDFLSILYPHSIKFFSQHLHIFIGLLVGNTCVNSGGLNIYINGGIYRCAKHRTTSIQTKLETFNLQILLILRTAHHD